MSTPAGTASFLVGLSDPLATAVDWLSEQKNGSAGFVIWCANDADCALLDRLLWTRSALSFLPHCGSESALADETPIVITMDDPMRFAKRCLINLAGQLPGNAAVFSDIVEFVSASDDDRQSARERYRHYRGLGFRMESRDLGKGEPS